MEQWHQVAARWLCARNSAQWLMQNRVTWQTCVNFGNGKRPMGWPGILWIQRDPFRPQAHCQVVGVGSRLREMKISDEG